MPAIETKARQYLTAGEILANAKETRARLYGSAPVKLPAQISAPAEPIAPRVTPQPALVAEIFEIIGAVCAKTSLSREEVFSGLDSRMSTARQIALALIVTRLSVPHDVAADHFGVLPGTVRVALSRVAPILVAFAIPRAAQIDSAVTCVVDNWELFVARADHATIGQIKQAVCEEFNLSRVEIEANRRLMGIVVPRQIALALCRRLTPRSLPYIGSHFGGKDHTTVLHAVQKMAPFLERAAAKLSPTATVAEWVSAVRAEWEAAP